MKILQPLLLLLVFSFTLSSCDSTEGLSCEVLEAAVLTSFFTALEADTDYTNDDSEANCLALKAALQDLIQKGEASRKCVEPEDLDEFEQDIADFEAQIAALPC